MQYLVIHSNSGLDVWDYTDKTYLFSVEGTIVKYAVSSRGVLALATGASPETSIEIWNLEDKKNFHNFTCKMKVENMWILDEKFYIFIFSEHIITIFDIFGTKRIDISNPFYSMALNSTIEMAYTIGNNTIQVYDASNLTGKRALKFLDNNMELKQLKAAYEIRVRSGITAVCTDRRCENIYFGLIDGSFLLNLS